MKPNVIQLAAASRRNLLLFFIFLDLFVIACCCVLSFLLLIDSVFLKKNYCSDFGNESNGIFVLGWVFFFRQTSIFEHGIFISHSKSIVVLSLNLFKKIHL